MRGLDRDLNTLVVGSRGVGKTSLFRQVQFALRNAQQQVTFVDSNAVTEPLELSRRIREALYGPTSPITTSFQVLGAAVKPQPIPPGGASRLLADDLRAIGEASQTTILIDASGSGDALYAIFGRMRDIVWQMPHTWAVVIDESDRPALLKPPADAFFDHVIAVRPWPLAELTELISQRIADDPVPRELVLTSARAADGNPREALRALNDALVNNRDPSVLLNRRARLLDQASQLGRPHGMLMAELLDRGQASPSDEELQASLGLTRSRLTHLLRELLEHRLVIAEQARQDSPGRPRTIYRPALPTE